MSLDRTERTELPEHYSGIKRAVDKGVRTEKLGQDKGVRTEKLGQDSWYRTAWTGQPGQDSRDGTDRTGKPGQENWDRKVRKTDRIEQPGQKTRQLGQVSLGRTERTSQDMRATLGQRHLESPGQDCWDRIADTGQLG